MSDSNRTQVSYVAETTWGTTPGGPTMLELRLTDESLIKNVSTVVSSELRSDRQVTDLVKVAESASGDINFELSYASYDALLRTALLSADWTADLAHNAKTDIAATGTGFSATVTNFSNATVGQFIRVRGFANNAINGFYRVTARTATSITTFPAPPATAVAGATVSINGSFIRNGVLDSQFTLEKRFTDVFESFIYRGMRISQFSLNVESQQIVTGSFGFIGKTAVLQATTLGTPTAANTNQVMNSVGNIGSIKEGDAEVVTPNFISSISLALNNNLREQYAVGSDSLIGIGQGKVDLTGTISTYFGNSDVMDKFLAGTETSIDFRISDDAGNSYLFDMPRIKFESGNVVAGGQDQDVFAEMNYRALRDQVYGFTFQINRYPL